MPIYLMFAKIGLANTQIGLAIVHADPAIAVQRLSDAQQFPRACRESWKKPG